jgi:hypothetical protein
LVFCCVVGMIDVVRRSGFVSEPLAEPALNALGISVEKVTNGNFPKSVVMYRQVDTAPTGKAAHNTCLSVAFGVAFGISAGVLKILQGWNLTYMLLVTYAIAIALTVLPTPFTRFENARILVTGFLE